MSLPPAATGWQNRTDSEATSSGGHEVQLQDAGVAVAIRQVADWVRQQLAIQADSHTNKPRCCVAMLCNAPSAVVMHLQSMSVQY